MPRSILMSVAALALAAAAPAAFAEAASDNAPQKITVRYADLDLSNPAHAHKLVSRIRIAARELCGPDVSGDMGRVLDRERCIREAQAQAVRKVNRSTVTAAFYGVQQNFAQVTAVR